MQRCSQLRSPCCFFGGSAMTVSRKLKRETHLLNAMCPLVVCGLDGADVALNQLPSTLLSTWQRQCRAAHPNAYPGTPAPGAAHAVLTAATISVRAISGQQPWALSVCLCHGSSERRRLRDDSAANPNKWSVRLSPGQSPFP